LTIRLFRVGNQPDAMYQSRDGRIQLAFREDHEQIEALPLFMEVSMSWNRLQASDQAFLFSLAEDWAARDEA